MGPMSSDRASSSAFFEPWWGPSRQTRQGGDQVYWQLSLPVKRMLDVLAADIASRALRVPP